MALPAFTDSFTRVDLCQSFAGSGPASWFHWQDQALLQFHYLPTVTREPFRNRGRLTHLLDSGQMCTDLGLPALDPVHDRAMICGNLAFNLELKDMLEAAGLEEGADRHRVVEAQGARRGRRAGLSLVQVPRVRCVV